MLRKQEKLQGTHPDLQRVIEKAAELAPYDIQVLEGVRTLEKQRALLEKGATTTMRSRHLTGHAVDLAPVVDTDGDGDVEVSWHWPHYFQLAIVVKQAAKACDVPIEWGGDWTSFKDGPHWQLPWGKYPVQ
jgi:peptidoglycan LD-endopeptidase CwlK